MKYPDRILCNSEIKCEECGDKHKLNEAKIPNLNSKTGEESYIIEYSYNWILIVKDMKYICPNGHVYTSSERD